MNDIRQADHSGGCGNGRGVRPVGSIGLPGRREGAAGFSARHAAQLREAIAVARRIDPGRSDHEAISALLLAWFWRPVCPGQAREPGLAGRLRAAHAGFGNERSGAGHDPAVTGWRDELTVDGWWRTWGDGWRVDRPPADTVLVHAGLPVTGCAEMVHRVTSLLLDTDVRWLFEVALRPDVRRRSATAILALDPRALSGPGTLAAARSAVQLLSERSRAIRVPLSRRLSPGVAVTVTAGGHPDFAAHRTSLVGNALLGQGRHLLARHRPFSAVASEFDGAGIEAGSPYRTRGQVWLEPLLDELAAHASENADSPAS